MFQIKFMWDLKRMPPLLRYVLKWSCVGVISLLVIMDDRSRLESHLKSLNKLQALSKVRRVLRGKLCWCSCSCSYTQAKCGVSSISRSWVVFFGAKNLPGGLWNQYIWDTGYFFSVDQPGKTWLMKTQNLTKPAASSCRAREFLFVEKPCYVFVFVGGEEWNKPDCSGYTGGICAF